MGNLQMLILRNMIRSRRQYTGYLLASTLAVATFFSFGFFMMHPDLQALVTKDYASAILQLFVLGQIGVALFAVFFVIFFHRFLLRLRGKEFGLLATLGMSPMQLARMVRLESWALAGLALTLGFVLSLGQTHLMFQLLGQALNVPPLVTTYSSTAIAYGLLFFVGLFAFDAYLAGYLMKRTSPKQMLVSPKLTQRIVRVSWLQVITGVLCLALGYWLALGFRYASAGASTAMILPMTVLVVLGTYLLFSQILIGVLSTVRSQTRSGLVLLSSSRLAHRVKDFARVLTIVSVLSAGVLTLMGVAFGVLSHLQQMAASQAEYEQMLRVFALLLFVFFFLAFLFFIAATSTLYVKLFTQVDEDRGQFASLRRLGVSDRGIHIMLSGELALLFFAPVFVASLHAAVAMGEFTTKIAPQHLSQDQVWVAFAGIVASFASLFICYFFLARWRYEKSLSAHPLR